MPYVISAVVVSVAVSCGGQSPTPVASGPRSASAPGTTVPPIASPTCEAQSSSLELTAKSIHFDKDCLAVPADTAFTIRLDNQDAGVPHDVAILDQSLTQTFFKGAVIKGVRTVTYQVKGLKAGTYVFHCVIHPNEMNGTLDVGA